MLARVAALAALAGMLARPGRPAPLFPPRAANCPTAIYRLGSARALTLPTFTTPIPPLPSPIATAASSSLALHALIPSVLGFASAAPCRLGNCTTATLPPRLTGRNLTASLAPAAQTLLTPPTTPAIRARASLVCPSSVHGTEV
ncbi:hypothetical protein CF642_39400, partial [Burkholderia pseudomallei]